MVNYKNWFIITLCSLFSISLLYLFVIYRCDFLNSGEIAWVHDCVQKKETIGRNIVGRKIVFDGGSATLFGVRTKDIERKTGIPCVNMATHGGLNIDYIFSRLKNILNKGDIVILPLEYHYFSYDGKLNNLTLSYIISFDKTYFRSLPLTLRIKYLFSLSPIDFYRTAMLKIFNKFDTYNVKTLNNNGDETKNIGNANISPNAQFNNPFKLPSGNFKETYGLLKIKEFNIWCNKHNITLYITYPNLVYLKEYANKDYCNYFYNLNKYFMENNIRTIGTPYDFFFNRELFYDTEYHLNEQGAIIRTEQLIAMLKKLDAIKFDNNH
jgi:hypothetical protein